MFAGRYSYLGITFRERERIKRKKQRWTDRLHRLPLLERQALLAAIDEAWRIPSPETAMDEPGGPRRKQRYARRQRHFRRGTADIAGFGDVPKLQDFHRLPR
jgi:hypothetical protein